MIDTFDKLQTAFSSIPWKSFGRNTPISRLSKSLVPVGNHDTMSKRQVLFGQREGVVTSDSEDFESDLLEIIGTAFQVGAGKLMTCWHVCSSLRISEGEAFFISNTTYNGMYAKRYHQITHAFSFIDPRHKADKSTIDVGIISCPARSTAESPYGVPIVDWGDSSNAGVGDRVLIGGYPLGRHLFLSTSTNRGIVQPTFYDGIISAVIPATNAKETRLFQISSVALAGISGGVVCSATSGKVLGMVVSGLSVNKVDVPITYAIPSEVLKPYAASISFKTADGKVWR